MPNTFMQSIRLKMYPVQFYSKAELIFLTLDKIYFVESLLEFYAKRSFLLIVL